MNLVIDIGNSLIKVGCFEKEALTKKEVFKLPGELKNFLSHTPANNVIISSVTIDMKEVASWTVVSGEKIIFNPSLQLPVQNRYATPATLGPDRLAAACGAQFLFPHEHCLIIDIGTCINYEFVNANGEYLGGGISPGVSMRFSAMHKSTAKLPNASPSETVPLTGSSTIQCLESGVMNGTLEEIKGIILRYQNAYPGIRVILCGGDSHFFENHLKPSIFVAPDLVLVGLNSILLQNVIS